MSRDADRRALAEIAARRRVVFVPVSVELADRLAQGERFSGTVQLHTRDGQVGEADLVFTPEPVGA